MKNFNMTFKTIATVISFLFISNVMYGQMNSPCTPPQFVSANAIMGHKVTIVWTGSAFDTYGIRIRTAGNTSWTNITVTSPAISKTITGLNSLTNYEYQIKKYCYPGDSVFSPLALTLTFATACECGTPSTLNAASLNATSATITWTGNSCAVNYRITYRIYGTLAWTVKMVEAPNVTRTLTALTANSTYEYRIRTDCNTNGSFHSNWSSVQTFTTALRLEGESTNNIPGTLNIFPNPTEGKFLMTLTAVKNENATLRIIDIIGNEVLHKEIALTEGDNNINIALADLADGLYLVRLESTEGMITNKLTIKN